MSLTLILISWRHGSDASGLASKFEDMDWTYLALLGGPYASFLLAKVAVQTKTSGEQLQKSDSEEARLADIFQNDNGQTDVVDFQYVLFNVVAGFYVLALFVPHPGTGIPLVPSTLGLLTGGAAATYVTNKAIAANKPAISAVFPTRALENSRVVVTGSFLVTPGGKAGDAIRTEVTVGGVKAKVDGRESTANRVTFIVPNAQSLNQNDETHEVWLVTEGGLSAKAPENLTVLPL